MKKITALILSVVLVFSLAACSNTQQNDASDPVSSEAPSHAAESTPAEVTETEPPKAEDDTEPASSEPEETKGSNILIAYFTYGENAELPDDVDASASASIQIFNGEVTGNTGVMARMIAEASGGELFSIRTVEPYPDNYNDTVDVGQTDKEQWHSSGIGYAYRKSGSVRYDFCWLPKLVVWYAYGNVQLF